MKGNRCTIALLSVIMVCLLAVPAMAADHHVNDGASVDAAIAGATAGDTIYVHDYTGTYARFTVRKHLYMIGVDMPTVDGSGGFTIKITANGCTVEGFKAITASGGYNEAEIVVQSSGNLIKDNYIDSNSNNAMLIHRGYNANSNTVINNTFESHSRGIKIYSNSNTIAENDFVAGYDSIGLYGDDCGSNLFYHNNFRYTIVNTAEHNTWYNSTLNEGNYYSAYTGNDCDNNGIGDTAHTVGIDTDSYPLINPWDGQVVTSNFNPVVTSCDVGGSEVNSFLPGDTVYVKATGLLPNTDYKIWIQPESVDEDEALITGNDPSGSQESVTSDANGALSVTSIWVSIPTGAATEYDIVLDCQGCGTGTYNAANDGLDAAGIAGFVAPVPELATLTLMGCGLGALFGLVKFKNRGKR